MDNITWIAAIFIVQQFILYIADAMDSQTISEITLLLSIIIANIFIFIIIKNIRRQNKKNQALLHIEAQSKIQQQYIEYLTFTYGHIRKIFHDFKHQTVLLHTLCKERYYDELLIALHQISNYVPGPIVINTGNIMLDTVLSSKKEEARKRDVQMDMKLDVGKGLSYIDIEYCVMLSNALDNAIEACERSIGQMKLIELELISTRSFFMFRMRNTLGEKPELSGKFFKSKKTDKLREGVGFKSMKQTCNMLGGDITYEFDEKYFMLWIYIPISE